MAPFAPLLIWGAVKDDEGAGGGATADPLTARWDDVALAIVCSGRNDVRVVAARLVEVRPAHVGSFSCWRGELGGRLRVAVFLAPAPSPFAVHAAAAQAAILCPNAVALAHFEGALACAGDAAVGTSCVGAEVSFLNLPRVVHHLADPPRQHALLSERAIGLASDAGEAEAPTGLAGRAEEIVVRAAESQRLPRADVLSSPEPVDSPMQRAWIRAALPRDSAGLPVLLDVGGAPFVRAATAAGRRWVLFHVVSGTLDELSPEGHHGTESTRSSGAPEVMERAAAQFIGLLREIAAQATAP